MLGALRCRAEKTAGARALGEAHVEVVLGDEIKIHACLIGAFQNIEMIPIKVDVGALRVFVLLHMIEESELHVVVLTLFCVVSFKVKTLDPSFSKRKTIVNGLPLFEKAGQGEIFTNVIFTSSLL